MNTSSDPKEPAAVRRARLQITFEQQANAIRQARLAELESTELSVVDEKDLDAIEQKAADCARLSALLGAAERRLSSSKDTANKLGAEVLACVTPIGRQADQIALACRTAVVERVKKDLRKFFAEPQLAAVVELAQAVIAERGFAESLRLPPLGGVDWYQGPQGDFCEVRSLAAVVNNYDHNVRALGAWKAHAKEIGVPVD